MDRTKSVYLWLKINDNSLIDINEKYLFKLKNQIRCPMFPNIHSSLHFFQISPVILDVEFGCITKFILHLRKNIYFVKQR
jgi:hypothetical protein